MKSSRNQVCRITSCQSVWVFLVLKYVVCTRIGYVLETVTVTGFVWKPFACSYAIYSIYQQNENTI